MAALGPELTASSYLNVLDGAARAGAAATCIDAADLAAIAAVGATVDPERLLRYGVRTSIPIPD